jgi:NRPS condensation-like uncharacterized protein
MERVICSTAPVFQSIMAIAARIRGPLSADALPAALARVVARLPLLGVRVGEVHRWGAHFVTQGVPAPSVRVIEGGAEDTWQKTLQQELTRTFPFEIGPLIRFVLIRMGEVSDLVLIANHVLLDGAGLLVLIREILWMLGDPAAAPAIPPIPAPMESLLPAAGRQPARLARSEQKPARGIAASGQAGPCTVLAWSLSEAESASLCMRSRAERTTVQAVICAAFLRAAAELDPSSTLRRVETPINLRGRIPQLTDDAFGNYMALLETAVDCHPGRSLWEIARAYKQQLLEQIDSEELFQRWRRLKEFAARIPNPVLGWLMRLLWRSALKINYDLSITNLGSIKLPTTYGPLRLETIHPPALSPTLPSHRLLSVVTFNGRISMALSSCDAAIAQQLQQGGLRHLRQALG